RPPPGRSSRRAHHRLGLVRRADHGTVRSGWPSLVCPARGAGRGHYDVERLPFLILGPFTPSGTQHPMIQPFSFASVASHEHATLETQALCLGYGDKLIVDKLSLSIPQGKVTAIVGPNGCGKSTLLAGMARLLKPTSGAVLLDGKAI